MITRFAARAHCLLLFTLFGFVTKAQLSANFSASAATGCAPLLVSFTDQSTGNPTEWKWDLGNGTISFLQNPSVSYFNPGFYTVKLVVKNGANTDSVVKTQFINVSAKPTVAFTSGATSGCYPLPVQFTDQSSAGNDSLTTWQWDFGDGFSSSEQNPFHVYTASGNYNVTLRVINNKGCLNTLSKSQYIHINPGVEAHFTNNTPNACKAPVTINFQNSSVGTGSINYSWSFGDGSISALQNPVHVYNAAGSYTVKLIATNASGCSDTLTKTNAFTVGSVSASFTTGDKICVATPLAISNTSAPAPTSVNWTFGDGTSSNLINPVKTYIKAGTYQIKLVANFGSCLDSMVKTITVSPSPVAAFTSGDSTNCSFPFTVDFTNQALNATSYQWDFGDNTTSVLANPVHVYNRYGSFDVQLTVTSANGCTNTFKKTNLIRIVKPNVIFNNLADSGCVPFKKDFSATTTSLDPVTGYFWDFGDGATATTATPTHTYTTAGVYAVKLIITTAGGCADTVIMPRGIITNNLPVPSFSSPLRDGCAKVPIKFNDQSTGGVTKWLWNFGDGATSILQSPQHPYQDTGYFDIQLIVWNSGCPDTVTYKKYIHINPPVAKFLALFDCAKPLERQFINQSIGADEWHWDFGDGSTSDEFSPVHHYGLMGTYAVSLLVRNHAGCDFTTVKTIYVVDVKATFFATDTIVCKGSPITFNTNLSLANSKVFDWDFGDGKTFNSTTVNSVAHLYTAPGNYTVRLITTNNLGCKDTLTKSSYIRINGPTAKFTPSVPGSCLNNLISFNDASLSDSIHPIQKWSWNYGDSIREILSAAPFQHNYTKPGSYLVTLKVTDSKGCTDSVNIAAALVISKPVAKFTPLDTVTCPSKQARFTNQSTGPGLAYLWNFGDGATSDAQEPVHNYSADGTYSVKLSVKDLFGCTDSINKPAIISIITPVAKFTMSDSFSICPPLIVQFSNLSSHAVSQKWDFGDGTSSTIFNPSHFYSYPGVYTVIQTVTAKGGCTDVMKKDIVINGPKGTFIYDPKVGCNPLKINFIATTQDRTSFIWDYSDGATVNTKDSVISHTYTNPGSYLPKMILTDINGCQVPITGKDTITVNGVTAKFNFSNKLLCDNGNITFTNSSVSNDIITGYQWSLGDSTTSAVQSPQHIYTAPGIYYPKLTVATLAGCKDSMASPVPVKVVASPQINMTSTASGCTPLTATFKGSLAVADTSALTWSWVFGNGNTSSLQNPDIQNYTVAGVYKPTLIVTNSSGCKDTADKTIEAFIIPQVLAGQDTIICNRTGIALQATGAASYNWSPSAGLSCINCANPVATPDSARKYVVKGTSQQGCSASDSVLVNVQYAFKIKYSKPDTLCKGQTLRLFASGTDRFEWSPSTGLDNSNIALPVGRPDTTTTYRVIGTDSRGCFKDTGYVFVKVYPIPVVDAGGDKTINVSQSVDLVPVISSDVTSVVWSPTGAIFRNTYPGITVKPNQTTDYTVEVKNSGGCMARGNVTVHVLCNGTNVFIPNTFSPNGDGANDVFYPRGTGLFKVKTLRIFNRWGEIVFEKAGFNANDPSSGWDGTFKGKKLGVDVFVYMIDIVCDNNSVLTYKGNVALIQ